MKKKILILIAVLILLAGAAWVFLSERGGDVSNVQRVIGKSALYTEEEITAAMDAVEVYFRKEFEGCILLELNYDSSWDAAAREWAERSGSDRAIVFTSSYYVKPNGGDGSLEQDSTYEDWQWIMVQKGNDTWEHLSHGYG